MLKYVFFSAFMFFSIGCKSNDNIVELSSILGDSTVLGESLTFKGFLGPCEKLPELDLYLFTSLQSCNEGIMKDAVFVHLEPYCEKNDCDFYRGKSVLIRGRIRYIDEKIINIHGIADVSSIEVAR